MPSLSSGGANVASLGIARAGLAVAIMAQTIFPLFTNPFGRTAGNNRNLRNVRNNRNVNNVNNFVFSHLALGLYVIPEAMTWFMGLFSRIMYTPSLPAPTAARSLSSAPQYNEPSPAYAYETFAHGYIAGTQPPAPALPSSTMSEWPLTYREQFWPNFREAPLFSFASDPTPMNEVAVWVQGGKVPGQDFLGTVVYPLAAAAVLIVMALLVGAMVDRVEIRVRRWAKRASRFIWRSVLAIGTSVIHVGLLLTLHSKGHMSSEDCTEAILYEIITHPKFASLGKTVALWITEGLHRLEVYLFPHRASPAAIPAFNQPNPSPRARSKVRDELSLGEETALFVVEHLWRFRTAFRGQRAVLNNKCHRVTARLIASLKRRLANWDTNDVLFFLGVGVLALVVASKVPRWIWFSGIVYWAFSRFWNKLMLYGLNKVLDLLKQDPLLGPLVHTLLIVKLDDDDNEQSNTGVPSNQTPPVSTPPPQAPSQAPTVPTTEEAIADLDGRVKELEDERVRKEEARFARRSRRDAHESAPVQRAPDPTAFHAPAAASLPPRRPDTRLRTPPRPLATSGQTSRRGGSTSLPSGLDQGSNRSESSPTSAGHSSERRAARAQERATLSYAVSRSSLMASLNGTMERSVQTSPSLWSVPTMPSVRNTVPTVPPGSVRSTAPSWATSPAPWAPASRHTTPPRIEAGSGALSFFGSPASSAATSRNTTPTRTWVRSGAPSPSESPEASASRMAAARDLATPPKAWERGVTPSLSSPTGSTFQAPSFTTPLLSPPSKAATSTTPLPSHPSEAVLSTTPESSPPRMPVFYVGLEAHGSVDGEETSAQAVDYPSTPADPSPQQETWSSVNHDSSVSDGPPAETHDAPTPTTEVEQPEQIELPPTPCPARPRSARLLNGRRVATDLCSLIRRSIPSSIFMKQEEGRQYLYQVTITNRTARGEGPIAPSQRVVKLKCKLRRRERSHPPEDSSVPQWQVDASPLLSGPTSAVPSPVLPPPQKDGPLGQLHLSRCAPGNEKDVLVFELNKDMMSMAEQFEHLSISSLEEVDMEWEDFDFDSEMAETMDEDEGSLGLVQMELDFLQA